MGKRQSNGSGHLHRRGKIYYYRYMINGKLKDISLKVTTELEAKQIVKKEYLPLLQAKSKEQIAVHVAESRKLVRKVNSVKIEDAWNYYLKSPSRPDSAKGTLKGYKCAYNDFLKWVENAFPSVKNFTEINEEVAHGYAQYLWNERKVSERTYNAYIKALHLIYRVLIPKEANPFGKENIARKNENQQGHKKFTEEEILKILNNFNSPELSLMNKDEMKVLFYLGALTGLRLVDCCLLQWDNISFHEDMIHCIPQKTRRIKRKAIIPIISKLKEQLFIAQDWKNENDYVLPGIAERYLRNPDGIRKDCIKVFKYSGLNTSEDKGKLQRQYNICRYGFHSFRHSFASIMASNGYNITMLAQILADDTKTLGKYYIDIDDKVIKKTFNDMFMTNSNTKLLSTDSETDVLINEINQKLKTKNSEQLKSIINYIEHVPCG